MEHTKRYGILAAGIAVTLLVAATVVTGLLDARAQTTPDAAVSRFYMSWIAALRQGEDVPYEKRLYRRSTYVSDDFARSVERKREAGLDAVLCIGTVPTTFSTKPARVGEEGKSASVEFQVDGVEGHIVLVRDAQNWWRIDEVDCPSLYGSDRGES